MEEKDIQPKKVVRSKKQPLNIDSSKDSDKGGGVIPPPPDLPQEYRWLKYQDYFGLDMFDRESPEVVDKLKTVTDWAVTKAHSNDPDSARVILEDMELKLGCPEMGATRLDKIWRYVKLSEHIQDLELRRDML